MEEESAVSSKYSMEPSLSRPPSGTSSISESKCSGDRELFPFRTINLKAQRHRVVNFKTQRCYDQCLDKSYAWKTNWRYFKICLEKHVGLMSDVYFLFSIIYQTKINKLSLFGSGNNYLFCVNCIGGHCTWEKSTYISFSTLSGANYPEQLWNEDQHSHFTSVCNAYALRAKSI